MFWHLAKRLYSDTKISEGRPTPLSGSAFDRLHSFAAKTIQAEPKFLNAFAPALLLSILVFARSPVSNYIFDEQEALLANPYVNSTTLPWLEAFKRDFWGLLPERSIGSYRPLPNLIWRGLWGLNHRPFFHHCVNIVVHAVNAALLSQFVYRLGKSRTQGWLAGTYFLLCAVLTEAVTGVVGLADVLGGLGTLLALSALGTRASTQPCLIFGALLIGLFSKESVIAIVPTIAWAAWVTSPWLHAQHPRRLLRASLALIASCTALVVYTEVRRRLFPTTSSLTHANFAEHSSFLTRALESFLHWFQQPHLPRDPINNPLVNTSPALRLAGALEVYLKGLFQIVCPYKLSGDYSFAAEPAPDRAVSFMSVCGALAMALPLMLAIAIGCQNPPQGSSRQPSKVFWSLGLAWVPLTYFPHSNIAVLLPTVRAERFWYLPAIGVALLLSQLTLKVWRSQPQWAIGVCSAFLLIQAIQARRHALDYNDDLTFWQATRNATPSSAKAHLNYSVMVGARGRLEERLAVNAIALSIAPAWPMAHVYYGDTLCRLHRAPEAWVHLRHGFELAPNELHLIALGLQCLWDEKAIPTLSGELLSLAAQHHGTWLAYLATDIVHFGPDRGGVDAKYRPRGYDEGPRRESK